MPGVLVPDKPLALGAGWGPGQLDEEVRANGWLQAPGDTGLVFDTNLETKWERAIFKLGIDPRMLSGEQVTLIPYNYLHRSLTRPDSIMVKRVSRMLVTLIHYGAECYFIDVDGEWNEMLFQRLSEV